MNFSQVYIMARFYDFDIEFWGGLGFIFRDEVIYKGLIKHGKARHGSWILNISIDSISIARIENIETNHMEHHVVTEEEAIRWFCRVSQEFKDKYLDYELLYKKH